MKFVVILIFIALIFLPSFLIAWKIKYDENKDKKKVNSQPEISVTPESETLEILPETSVEKNTDELPTVEQEEIKIEEIQVLESPSAEPSLAETPVSEELPVQKEKKKRGRKPGRKNKTTSKPGKKGGDQLLLS